MATCLLLRRAGLALLSTAFAAGCGRSLSPPPVAGTPVPAVLTEAPAVPAETLRFQLPAGSTIEVRGNEQETISRQDGTLSIVGGERFQMSCRVPWTEELPMFWKVSFFWMVEGRTKESEIASTSPRAVTREEGVAIFTCEVATGRIPTTPDCHMKIEAYDGSRWRAVDRLDGITMVKR